MNRGQRQSFPLRNKGGAANEAPTPGDGGATGKRKAVNDPPASQRSASKPRIEHAAPSAPRHIEVASKVTAALKAPTAPAESKKLLPDPKAPSQSQQRTRRGATTTAAATATSGSASKASTSAGTARLPTNAQLNIRLSAIKESVNTKPPSSPLLAAASSFAPSAPGSGGSGVSTASSHSSVEQLRAQLGTQMEDNSRLTEALETESKRVFTAETKCAELKESLKREAAATEAEATERARAEGEVADLRAQLLAAQAQATDAAAVEERLRTEKADLEEVVAAREATIQQLAERGRAQEELRRRMHETISELKGNIRVFCRVRPPDAASATKLVRVPSTGIEPTGLELLPANTDPSVPGAGNRQTLQKFKFDRVFSETASQEEIFREVSQLTQSALDGHRVCIFAYGQTGSGKTFTMQGSGGGESRGVVPRAAKQVFDTAADLATLGWAFDFEASCLEIYNEELRDLLPDASGKAKGDGKLKISDDGKGNVAVPGLRTVKVTDAQRLADILEGANRVRKTSATKCNDQSSRSHYLFRMAIRGRNAKTGQHVDGELNLIDLAGSERTKLSEVQGQALKEANAINNSLLTLGAVISKMGELQEAKAKDSKSEVQVPFRESKLTHVLKGALSGSAKTLMFVNINPGSYGESLSSLNFASRVGNVKMGLAKR